MGLELDYIFHPKSIAVAGASESRDKQGHTYFRNLLEDFQGKVYPINHRVDEVSGIPAYKSIRDLPENVDYVISAIPNRDILDLIDACATKGVKTLHLFTARFSETHYDKETELEQELLKRARANGIRIIGPNCMGLYYPKEGISFGRGFPKEAGSVGIISQSGGNASEIASVGASRGLRFSKLLSYGNALDLNEADLMEYLADDPETEIIGGYIEGVRDGPRFVKALQYASRHKPVILLKGGRTEAGTSMVSTHTASMAGARGVWEAMCKQTHAINVYSMEELLDMLAAFYFMPSATGYNVIVGGGAGGRSVLSADECEDEGLNLVPIPEDVRAELTSKDAFFGPWVNNPVDGSMMGGSNLQQDEVVEIIARSPAYDLAINNIMAGGAWGGDPRRRERALQTFQHSLNMVKTLGKPVALVIPDTMPQNEEQFQAAKEIRDRCLEAGFPIFPSTGRASKAVYRLVAYYRGKDSSQA